MAVMILSICFAMLGSGICGAHDVRRTMCILWRFSHVPFVQVCCFLPVQYWLLLRFAWAWKFVITSWPLLESAVFCLCLCWYAIEFPPPGSPHNSSPTPLPFFFFLGYRFPQVLTLCSRFTFLFKAAYLWMGRFTYFCILPTPQSQQTNQRWGFFNLITVFFLSILYKTSKL